MIISEIEAYTHKNSLKRDIKFDTLKCVWVRDNSCTNGLTITKLSIMKEVRFDSDSFRNNIIELKGKTVQKQILVIPVYKTNTKTNAVNNKQHNQTNLKYGEHP